MSDDEREAASITIEQQTAAVIREIALRERVYPNWVKAGRMTQAKADHEIAAMRAVLKTLLAKEITDKIIAEVKRW